MLNKGYPQGSNFGPLLWNVFQNDLVYNAVQKQHQDACSHLTIKFMLVVKRWKMRKRDFNGRGKGNLKLVPTQFVENKCNRDKFQSMSLRQRHLYEVMKIKVYEKYVESGPEMKLLGVIFNEHLKFNSHLDERDRIMIELRV